jgi:TonB family protein
VPLGWALGAATAVAALALGIVGWALWPRSGMTGSEEGTAQASASLAASSAPEALPSASPALQTAQAGALRIESEPSGANVVMNGEAMGRTPLRLSDLRFGSYTVRVERKGYETQVRDVSLSAEAAAGELRFVLARPAAPAQGEADVVSTPAGASVSVDGRPVGTTPLRGIKLRPGRRRLEVNLDGHETWTDTVDVVAGEAGRVEVHLEALPRPSAPPTPAPVDPARVYDNTTKDVDTPAKKLSGSSPSYPSDRAGRLKSGERVSVLVRFVVTEAGEVRDVSVVESGGRTAVDDVVVAAIRGWRYQPAVKQGTRVKVQVTFKQTFLGG